MFYTSPGYEYMVALSARYSVLVDDDFDVMAHEADDIAWERIEKALKDAGFEKKGEGRPYTDHNKLEIYETVEISPSIVGYRVVVDVNFEIHVTEQDAEDAYESAIGEVESVDLPEKICLMWTEQTSFMVTGERVLIAHGDDV